MVVDTLKLIRAYRAEVVIFIVLLVMIFSSIYCLGKELSYGMAITMPAIVTAIGVLLANRIHHKMQLPELSIKWNYFLFEQEKSIRVFVEVRNKDGRKIAREAKAMITIKKISKNGGKEGHLEEGDLLDLRDSNVPLVPRKTPIIEDELIPWMVPETPQGATGLDGIHLKHIANISPGQVNRAPLFDIKLISDEDYLIFVFSEYGTETEMVPRIIGGHRMDSRYKEKRYVRCILKKGRYKFKVKVVADETIPAEGELLIDELLIHFKKPSREKLDIKEELNMLK